MWEALSNQLLSANADAAYAGSEAVVATVPTAVSRMTVAATAVVSVSAAVIVVAALMTVA